MVITSSPSQGAITLSDDQMKKLAKLVAEAIADSGSLGTVSFPTSNPTKSTVQMDESVIDVGVSLHGIETVEGSIAQETLTSDNVSSATSKLKTLKGK
jgi:hypothetical protein